MELTLIKNSIMTIFKGLVLLLAFLFILTKCTSCIKEPQISDSKTIDSLIIKNRQDSIKLITLDSKLHEVELKSLQSENKADSLMNQKKIDEKKYRNLVASLRADLLKGKCDTFAILTVLNQCDSVINEDNRVIAQKDSVISNKDSVLEIVKEENTILKGMVDTSRNIIKEKDNQIAELEKKSKKALRKQKWITRLVIVADAIKDGLLIFGLSKI